MSFADNIKNDAIFYNESSFYNKNKKSGFILKGIGKAGDIAEEGI